MFEIDSDNTHKIIVQGVLTYGSSWQLQGVWPMHPLLLAAESGLLLVQLLHSSAGPIQLFP